MDTSKYDNSHIDIYIKTFDTIATTLWIVVMPFAQCLHASYSLRTRSICLEVYTRREKKRILVSERLDHEEVQNHVWMRREWGKG